MSSDLKIKPKISHIPKALAGLLDPWLFLRLSASFLPGAAAELARAEGGLLGALRAAAGDPARLRAAWFGRFWAGAGPGVRENAGARVAPLLDGRARGGSVVPSPAGPGVGGVVLEVGPGSGLWVDLFSDRHLYATTTTTTGIEGEEGEKEEGKVGKVRRQDTARTPVTRVYGVEPNAAHHAALRRAVEAAGLRDVYEIVPVGIEDLSSSSTVQGEEEGEEGRDKKDKKKWDGNISPGSVDCIVSVLCLCSIPDPERNVRGLYELLRPGGRWYVYEHVQTEYSWYMRLYQHFINIFWPQFIGGCELCRPTEKTLREAGPWTNVDVGHLPTEMWFHCLPHILGVFTK
ncbi:putative methyltransferase domain-containing protein [Rosellinia necatrix]|uniref:Putative methyltransferase domain-containing protein n=1 Tax=Rosellinia necatrix TaxID=77044 RepID=A0A1W2TCW5_ROSNE|nr:putative methyltransferase domain-containing protein [Rosellinia necatrix]